MGYLDIGSDPPIVFPVATRKPRTGRIPSKRKATNECPTNWRYLCPQSDVTGVKKPINEVQKKRTQKFRNLNTGRVFRKECQEELHKPILPANRGKMAFAQNSQQHVQQPPVQAITHHEGMTNRLGFRRLGQPMKVESRVSRIVTDWGTDEGHLTPSYDAVFYPTNVVDSESLQWCDGRYVHKSPNYALLEAMLAPSVEKHQSEDVDPSKMYNRSSGAGDGRSNSTLHSLRRGTRKRGSVNKDIYVSRHYRKPRVREIKPKSYVGDPMTMNHLDPANLGHIAKELRESIGRSTGDISILLKVLKDSKFDAVKAVEHGLDRVLVEIVELASEPSIARPAAEILDAIRKVL